MNLFRPPLRPPGAAAEHDFLKLCVRCGQCVEACPHNSLALLGGFGRARRTPYISPAQMPCYLCMKCPPACPTGALDAAVRDMRGARMGQAYILKDRCHNYTDGTICMTCYDRCPLRGSAVVLSSGIVPAITTACVGCGVCEYVCPVKAVEVLAASATGVPPHALPTLTAPGGDA